MTGVSGSHFNQLNNPNSAELLDNGHVLIADENNNRVIEVDRFHRIVWHYDRRTARSSVAPRSRAVCRAETP